MSFATANRTDLKRVKETTWGTTPASPALKVIRYTGETLDDGITTEKSKEIRADRMVSDLIITDAAISGDVNFELSYASFDDFFESAFMTAVTTAVTITEIAGDISSSATAFTSTLGTKFNTIPVGAFIKVAGFTNPGNNGLFYVTAQSGTSLTVSPAPAAVETPAGAAATIKTGAMLRNGVTEQSYTIAEIFNDATVLTRRHFLGMRVKGFTLDMKTGSILTGKFSFIGKSASYVVAAFGGETSVAANTNQVMNCVNNIAAIEVDGVQLGSPGSLMSATIEFDNNHRGQKGLGVLGNVGVVASQLGVKVTGTQYFEDKSQADKFKASTSFRWSVILTDAGNNSYVLTLPRCKYDSFKLNSSQLDSDAMAQVSFQALADTVSGCMAQWEAFVGP